MGNGYVAVGEVVEKTYRIPKYQRGYRWEKKNVSQLLKDMFENRIVSQTEINKYNNYSHANGNLIAKIFNESDINQPIEPYCIQPLVVMRNEKEESFDVIDGQQRLTSIAIIRAALKNVDDSKNSEIKPVDLSYESRSNSAVFLKKLYDNTVNDVKENNIDFEYMIQAYNVAIEFFLEALKGIENQKVKEAYKEYLDNILCWNTRFIWYEVVGDNPQKIFANFNTGKIELTNAELIKALFMNPSNYDSINIQDKQIVISEKWDEIENELHSPDFWAFVPHRGQYEVNDSLYSTRIDIIFDFFIMENWIFKNNKSIDDYIQYKKQHSSDKYLFNEIDNWIKEELSKNNTRKNEVMDNCWAKIRKVFLGLKELYLTDGRSNNKNKIYNLAGLYINLRNKNGCVDTYIDSEEEYLKIYYVLSQILQKPRNIREKELLMSIKKVLKIDTGIEKHIKTIRYNDGDASNIVRLLLTYNIAILNNSGGIGERFNFLANAQNKWQREHIFASNTDENKTESIGLNRIDERKAALKILSTNEYLDYVNFVYNISNSSLRVKINDQDEVLDINNDEYVQEFINGNIGYDRNGYQELYARALKARRDSKILLEYYECIDTIDGILSDDNKDIRNNLIYKLLESIGLKYATKEYIDVSLYSEKIQESIKDVMNKDAISKIEIQGLNWEYSISQSIYEDIKGSINTENWFTTQNQVENKTNIEALLSQIQNSYTSKIKNIVSGEGIDSIKSFNNINEWEILVGSLLLCKKTLENNINCFFEEDFTKLLKDNSMGNMTLLTGGRGGQNQAVGNKPYGEKKKIVNECFKCGEFVPLGTIFVFSDLYNMGINTSKFWLPDSRFKYIKNMITTLKKFFGETEENDNE
ncbi:DUF262 domain-containing protein [Clostridium sartagoforme]|uniref:DUF262 domain-containing protein n=1 Tax=Clostridium sartagoforme TaxID=84031 RepID=UPI0031E42FB6